MAVRLCLVISLLLASNASASYGGPAYVSPVGPPTLPPSSYEGGLFTRPNPIDSSGNRVITGNVQGGKHFRGSVPYDSPTSFGAPLGTTRLDSFMRYSAIPQGTGDYRAASGYDTFYSPTGTVSQIRPGQTGVSAPTSPRVAGGIGQWQGERPADVVDISDIIQPRVSGTRTSPVLDTRADMWRTPDDWSLSRTPEAANEIVAGEPGRQRANTEASLQADPAVPSQEYQRQLDRFRDQLEKIKADASQLERSLATREALPAEASKEAVGDTSVSAVARPAPAATLPIPPVPDRRSEMDSLWRPANGLPDAPGPTRQARGATDAADGGVTPYSRQSGVNLLTADAATRASRIAELFGAPAMRTSDAGHEMGDGTPALQSAIQAAPDVEDDSTMPAGSRPAELSAATQPAAQQVHLDAASQAKFDQHMKVAEAHHQQGQYEQAAEAYALASVYKPTDPRVHLGRSLVLLASGDFGGSAVYLMKAVELDAPVALAKVNLVDLIGGPDAFIKRITELEELAATASEKPDLQFLLAYMYYQMDRPLEAAIAIAAAEQRLPRSRPVALLKAVIAP